ncbi:MAG: hypothetical protein QOC81_3127 [Thermoanaerobaculia bacterium]|jgi:hypothetical protein|nr:hypothetical protein [Thermoanaerobaculia bacterium]
MTSRFRALFILLLTLTTVATASARTIVVPAGTSIHFKLLRTISTASARPGQSVPAALTAPIVIDGVTVARTGSPAEVHIRNAEASGRIGGSATLTFSLASITLANGRTVGVRTSSYSREGKAHAKHNATYIAGAGVIGALAGQALGGNRDSTTKGAAIGAGVGIAAAAGTGKFDFSVAAGHRFSLRLRSAIRAAV